ncbi:hypothetical protein Taro_051275 [Colocasia esculenta]|uniref:Transmembrane 9 superfamily member n=1 Tax=Colocasia esculenta TaxID=4460 RepID=A0A843XGM5_COLES|nr:hypothetical protein [Colocasia esculenta]
MQLFLLFMSFSLAVEALHAFIQDESEHKYSHDEESAEDQEETGWKYIHGDVFKFPALTIFIFSLALVGVFYPYNRGALFTALVVIYALTSGIAGYTATFMYLQLEGTTWVRNLLLTCCLFCGPLFLTFCFLNTVAVAYSATEALPFGPLWMNLVFYFLNSIFWINQVAPTLVPLLKFYFHEEVRKATVSAIMFSQVGSGEGTCLRVR